MKIFNERLRLLRNQKKFSQEQMANEINLSLRGYRNYETGEKMPSFENLIALAVFFDVSIDYLVGRDDEPKRIVFKEIEIT